MTSTTTNSRNHLRFISVLRYAIGVEILGEEKHLWPFYASNVLGAKSVGMRCSRCCHRIRRRIFLTELNDNGRSLISGYYTVYTYASDTIFLF
nr:unnamed protein product [Haemonchus contortus]